jgi:hypothetical protein
MVNIGLASTRPIYQIVRQKIMRKDKTSEHYMHLKTENIVEKIG